MKRVSMLGFLLAGVLTLAVGTFQKAAAEERTVELQIIGCSCGGTFQTVDIIISRIQGVKQVYTSRVTQAARITFDDSKTGPANFLKALRDEHILVIGETRWIR